MTAIIKHILYKGQNEQMKIAPFLNQFFTYLESSTSEFKDRFLVKLLKYFVFFKSFGFN